LETINTATQNLESSITNILKAYDNPKREGLLNTPHRVVKALNEMLICLEPKISVFDSFGYDQMITDTGIDYYTFCEHHLLPFFGQVTISYIPDNKIIGLSKLSRIVNYFAKRLNTQEYFTDNIANYLQEKLEPKGIGVYVTGRHLCKEMRGIKQKGIMKTTALKGIFYDEKVRNEFMNYIHNNHE
jgi:GTP cyclohydrolase I